MRPLVPAAVLFDFDGLICDTERAGHRAWQELYAEHGLHFPPALWQSMVGRHGGEHLAVEDLTRSLAGDVDAAALAARRRRRKDELCEAEPLRPGVLALLHEAADGGIPAVLVSSASSTWVTGHLERLGVLGRFAFLITGDLTERHKPHPDLYQLALRRLGCRPGDALAFEDSPVGVRAARAAGVPCVAVANAVGDPAELAGADTVLPSLADHTLIPEGSPA